MTVRAAIARLVVPRGSEIAVDPRRAGASTVAEATHQRLTYRPDLDGLRAVSILLVIVGHSGLPGNAAAGVTAFFVLSGYLITGNLLRGEGLRTFYVRRIRRLAPAFMVMLGVMGVLGVAGLWKVGWPDHWVASVFYVTNWPIAFGSDPHGLTDHAWSLAIEEQFYLSWPLLLLAAGPRKALWIALVAIAVALIVRAGSGEQFGYNATIARLDGLGVGCVLAISKVRFPRSVGLAGLALLAIGAASSAPLNASTTLGVVAAGMIVGSETPLGPLASIGKRAYSLYLWNWPLTFLGLWPLTFVAGELSYRFVERPFLRRASVGRELAIPPRLAWRFWRGREAPIVVDVHAHEEDLATGQRGVIDDRQPKRVEVT